MVIRNPLEWVAETSIDAGHAIQSAGRDLRSGETADSGVPVVRRIEPADLRDVISKGLADFAASRTDVIFLCVFYPLAGLFFARLASGNGMLPLLFPLASGFALVGPLAGVGLYEMSRLREQGVDAGWSAAFGVIRSPSFGAIALLGLLLGCIFVVWLLTAQAIYQATLGLQHPATLATFASAVFTTPAGWAMIVVGIGVGFVFAVIVFAISVVSFPMLLDRKVGVNCAVSTSIRAVAANPRAMVAWAAIIAGSLVLGSIPLFLGLVIVLPVFGHATWHLYRKVVAP